MRFLLDEDVNPAVARVARGLGLDVISVHEIGRTGSSDDEQLRFATGDGRILVTRNRDDFIVLTRTAFATNRPHAGVLIVVRRLPNHRPAVVAHALATWARRFDGVDVGDTFLDFVG